jgi:cell division protein ZapA
MNNPDDSISVEIYDQTYHLRGGPDPGYVKRLATSLDEKMREIADATRTIDSLKVAVLAALTMADEVERLKQENLELSSMLTEKTEACIKLLDSVMQESQ